MKLLKATAAKCLVAVALVATPTLSDATEVSGVVQLAWISVSTNVAATNSNFYFMVKNSWLFANCSVNMNTGQQLYFPMTHISAKEWASLLMTARAAGLSVQIVIEDCTSLTVRQITVQ